MIRRQKEQYRPVEELRAVLEGLTHKKFKLGCGHLITINHNLGNSMIIYNDRKKLTIICTMCGY